MSVETIHNSKEIDSMFCCLGLSDDNSNLKKAEKCRIIRDCNYNRLYSSIYPESYKSIIYTDTPMLCLRMKSLEQNEQTDLWKSSDYIADEKIDGLRCYMAYNFNYDKNNGYEFFSRENNEDTLLPKNISNYIIKKISKPDKFFKSFLLDCELVINDDSFTIYCFDCLYFNDNYITNECLYFRRYITEHIVESINDPNVTVTRYAKTKKLDFFNFIKNNGGEGVVLKNINSKYTTKGSRSIYNWVKVKGNIFDYSIIEDTLEGYISEPIKSNDNIVLSAFIDNNEYSNKVAEIPFDFFGYVRTNNHFNVSFGLGSVVEFSSTFFSQKEHLFKNAFPLKLRVDKSIKDCNYLKEDLVRWSA